MESPVRGGPISHRGLAQKGENKASKIENYQKPIKSSAISKEDQDYQKKVKDALAKQRDPASKK